jgi:hypothetical protein
VSKHPSKPRTKTVHIQRSAATGQYVSHGRGRFKRATVTVHEPIGKPKPLPDAPPMRGDKCLSDLVIEER